MQIILFLNNYPIVAQNISIDCTDDDLDIYDVLQSQELSHSEIINRCNFDTRHIINARLSSDKSILHTEVSRNSDNTNTSEQQSTTPQPNNNNVLHCGTKSYSSMLKLICGTLVGTISYHDVYTIHDTEVFEDNAGWKFFRLHAYWKLVVFYPHITCTTYVGPSMAQGVSKPCPTFFHVPETV